MKKNYLCYLIASILFLNFMACGSDDDTPDLIFEKTNYTVMTDIGSPINIQSGSGKYILTPGDEDLISAVYVEPGYCVSDKINITAKSAKTGKTTLKVEDEKTGQIVVLNIAVTKMYFPIRITDNTATALDINNVELVAIKTDILKNAPAQKHEYIVLVKDEVNTMYIMNKGMDKELYKGTYSIIEEEVNLFLALAYKKDGKDVYRKLAIKNGEGINMLIYYLRPDWNTESEAKSSVATPLMLEMYEDLKDKYIEAYPDLSKASLDVESIVDMMKVIPSELVM